VLLLLLLQLLLRHTVSDKYNNNSC